ncbi:LPXTG cell wall anchor domain-containing protein [Lacticaseibacillus chiayiensis]|uniref:LPXTG cell wall anchor domain-containing protein n=1 Tax=Lacticaseibacillus chiayiensis TaxID=2100821 RepID=UPI001028722C|nr:LPXTG cell wall anchor domain-containing protein [Lacticaseibacillus chiayiensis]RXT58894.1 hypothetical protein CHT97_03415 [Lacticaseibacillus chiayiensis]
MGWLFLTRSLTQESAYKDLGRNGKNRHHAQGRVPFSTDDPQFKRNVFYHFELPDQHVTVGYNWNLIGGETADEKAAVVSVKLPAIASASSQSSSSQASSKASQKPSAESSVASSRPSVSASSSENPSKASATASLTSQTSQAATSAASGSNHGLPQTGEALGQSGLLAGLATLLSALGAWLWRRQG